jgi:hypothetical protein
MKETPHNFIATHALENQDLEDDYLPGLDPCRAAGTS